MERGYYSQWYQPLTRADIEEQERIAATTRGGDPSKRIIGLWAWQSNGRPAWQSHLTADEKLYADRLFNAAVSTSSEQAVDEWNNFALAHGASI